MTRLNPDLPAEAIEDAFRKLMRTDAPSLVERNRAMHRMMVDGVTVEYRRIDSSIGGVHIPENPARHSEGKRPLVGAKRRGSRNSNIVAGLGSSLVF